MTEADIVEAARRVAVDVFGGFVDNATGFNCREADTIAMLIKATGGNPGAFIEAHAEGDDEGDEHHNGGEG